MRRVGRLENLEHTLGGHARWANRPGMMHLLHVFDHPDYNAPEKVDHVALGLRARRDG